VAAREAAARCVLARDDAADAALVAQQAANRNAVGRCPWLRPEVVVLSSIPKWCRDVAREKEARESADGHAKARRDAVAASFAAREAGVRCAAASRRAVSAASIARKIASRCEGAGADGVAAAAAAREAADRCATDAALGPCCAAWCRAACR
jgi:hypothetical protein